MVWSFYNICFYFKCIDVHCIFFFIQAHALTSGSQPCSRILGFSQLPVHLKQLISSVTVFFLIEVDVMEQGKYLNVQDKGLKPLV